MAVASALSGAVAHAAPFAARRLAASLVAALCATAVASAAAPGPHVAQRPRAAVAGTAGAASGCVAALRDVRHAIRGAAFTSHYVFAGPYAYGEFRVGGFGGQSLWRRTGAGYCRVTTGARALDAPGLVASGVPPATAGALRHAMAATGELAPPRPEAPVARLSRRAPQHGRVRADRQARR